MGLKDGNELPQLDLLPPVDQQGAVHRCAETPQKQGGKGLPDGLLVSTNYYVNSDWLFAVPSDAASWEGLTRRSNLIALCEAAKGEVDAQRMMKIIETPIEEGGAQNELTVYQLVVVPETLTLWLRVIGGTDWIRIDLAGFLLESND